MTSFEVLYQINNLIITKTREQEIISIIDALKNILDKDKRKKFILLTSSIFVPRTISENVPGRMFLDETTLTPSVNPADIYVSYNLFNMFKSCGAEIGIVHSKTDYFPADKMTEYKLNLFQASSDKWEVYTVEKLRFNIKPTDAVISNSISPGQFTDIIIDRGVSIIRENKSYMGTSGDYVCWNLKTLICQKLILEINNTGIYSKNIKNELPKSSENNLVNEENKIQLTSEELKSGSKNVTEKSKSFTGSNEYLGNINKQNELKSATEIPKNFAGANGHPEIINEQNRTKSEVPIINNESYQLTKLKQYLDHKHVDAKITQKILEHHGEFISSLSVKPIITWKLKQLKWSNIYCYGPNNVINFTKLSGLVSLVGKNKTGKSSVLDILIYLLFGYINRGSTGDLLNRFTSLRDYYAELIFNTYNSSNMMQECEEDTYLIIRKSKNEVSLYCNGKHLSSNTKDVYSKIENIIGSRENFIYSVLSTQESTQFLDLGSSVQQKVLESLFNLDILKEKHNEVKIKANELKKLQVPPPLPETKINPSEILTKIAEEEGKVASEENEISQKISELTKNIDSISDARVRNVELLSVAKSELEKYQRQLLKTQSDQIKELREKISLIEKTYNFTWDSSRCNACKSNQAQLSRITGYDVAKIELERLLRNNKTQESMIAENKLVDCRNNIGKLEKERSELEQRLAELNSMRDGLSGNLGLLRKKKNSMISLLEKSADKIKNIKTANLSYDTVRAMHDEYERKKTELEIYPAYADALDHKHGLSHIILQENANLVCNRMNELLSKIAPFKVAFEFSESKFIIKIVQDNQMFDISLGSGYQKFVINLVLRIVAANQACISMPKFLIIDEGFGCLDSNNLGSVTSMLHGIKKHFDFILLISHINELQNLSDIKLNIVQDNGISKIQNSDMNIQYEFSIRSADQGLGPIAQLMPEPKTQSRAIASMDPTSIISIDSSQIVQSNKINVSVPKNEKSANVAESKNNDTSCMEIIGSGGNKKYFCKICKTEFAMRKNVDVNHVKTKIHQKNVGKNTTLIS